MKPLDLTASSNLSQSIPHACMHGWLQLFDYVRKCLLAVRSSGIDISAVWQSYLVFQKDFTFTLILITQILYHQNHITQQLKFKKLTLLFILIEQI